MPTNDHLHRFHAVFCVAAAGPDGITRGGLARRFRARAVRLERDGLTALLEVLVGEGALEREKVGRAEHYRTGPQARALLSACSGLRPECGGLRYSASEVAAVLAFAGDASAGESADASITAAVRALAPDTATGLVTMAALRRLTGLDREALHTAVRAALEAGELLLHPIAARHQASVDEMADGIRTPSGQVLYYVELA